MRICIISKYLPPFRTDGIPRNRWEYAKQFASLGHEVHIITSGEEHVEEKSANIFVHSIVDWDEMVYNTNFLPLDISNHAKRLLCYSYLVYKKIKELNEKYGIDILDAPLWDLEGYMTKILLPAIPMVVRLESTTMLIREIKEGQLPVKDDQNHLETHFLQIADGYVFDSWSIVVETERLYQIDLSKKKSAMIYHGIELPDEPTSAISRKKNKNYRVLIVGRMEKRKGTDMLIVHVLPGILTQHPDIEFHFVGSDNSEWDGFKSETGYSYSGYLKRNFSKFINKTLFVHGYVNDEVLDHLFDESDCVVALSRYESFGLLYVEAMRKKKPLVVLNTGAVPEIFENNIDSIIISPDEPDKVKEAIIKLKSEPAFTEKLVRNAEKKLHERFQAKRMGEECLAFFEKLTFKNPSQRVFQIMNALSDRDGVSNITIDYNAFFASEYIPSQILGTWATDSVKHLQKPIESVEFTADDILLYHYWNYCGRAEYFNSLKTTKKVFVFHNMTTPSFFIPGEEGYDNTTKGFKQLALLDNFDLYVGFSRYSIKILEQTIKRPIKTFVLPPLIDANEILNRPFSTDVVQKNKLKSECNILFVGRICTSKKQTDLIKFINFYVNEINPEAHLTLIGGGEEKFLKQLDMLISHLNLEKKVTVTGKVVDRELYGYYRSAHIYLSMSEHEGFGIPLAEAMAFEIPVVAYNCTSIEDTVSDNGCLFKVKDNKEIAKLIEKIRNDSAFKLQVINKQNNQMKKFSAENVRKSFENLKVVLYNNWNKRHADTDLLYLSPEAIFTQQNEVTVYYNSDLIYKEGNWEYRDEGFIKFESDHSISKVSIFAEFQSYSVNLLTHDWGGKVRISVDDVYVETSDLYSPQWQIAALRPKTEFLAGLHKLTVEALFDRNSKSSGFETLLRSISLYGDNLPVVFQPNRTSYLSNDIYSKGRPSKSVHLQNTWDISTDHFLFTGKWEIKEDKYKYAEGKQGKNECSFELTFSELELGFLVHDWSGCIKVVVDDIFWEVIDLYSLQHIEKRIKLSRVFEEVPHQVTITILNVKNNDSYDYQVFFKDVITHHYIQLQVEENELINNYKVSINVNTMNRARNLEKLLKALESQTYPYFEVVVVNGPSTDDTAKVLMNYRDKIKITTCAEPNLSMSRNIGVKNSAGNYIAYIDDDALPYDKYWLEDYIYYLIWKKSNNIGALGGPVKHKDTEYLEYKNGISSDYAVQIFDESDICNENIDGNRWFLRVCGCNNIMNKKALYEIGGFDENLHYYLDETDVCLQMWRKGYLVENHPWNYVRHYKAVNDFRKSDHDIRWDIVSRSDTYFVIKNADDVFLIRFLKVFLLFPKKHFYKEVHGLYRTGKIDKSTFRKYKGLLWKGFFQGLKWGVYKRKTSSFLDEKNTNFRSFNLSKEYELALNKIEYQVK